MYNIYHAKYDSDALAIAAMKQLQLPTGAEVFLSYSFGHGSAVLVLTMPAEHESLGDEWTLVDSFGPKPMSDSEA